MLEHLWAAKTKKQRNKETPIINSISTGNSRNDTQHPGNIELPKIEIKQFRGDPTNWKAFIKSFDAAFHLNLHLTSTEK